MKKKFRNVSIVLLFISSLIFAIYLHIEKQYLGVTFEQLLFSLAHSSNTSKEVLINGAKEVIITYMFIYLIVVAPIMISDNYKLTLQIRRLKIKILPINSLLYSILIFITFLIISFNNIGLFKYIIYQNTSTNLYDTYYTDPNEVNIVFKEKRNLIHIYLESMETTYFSKVNGGIYDDSLIPELEEFAENNLNFSNTNKLGGFVQLYGTGWTVAAMVAQSSGIPLKVLTDGNFYGSYKSFLPGAGSVGEILKTEGYNQFIMFGSDAKFGGREYFYDLHGNYEILDYKWAKKSKKIDEDYNVWWGYEDKKLFDFAKEKLIELSNDNEPFNFTLLTADTHFPDGYVDENCPKVYNNNYANSFACSSKMIADFIYWIQEQAFYSNTTIVLSGDHLGMQDDFYNNVGNDYDRTVYNVFINSYKKPILNKSRQFSAFDMFPTILSSIGANIEGNKLGFGTDLFSNDKTILEILGYNHFNKELEKKSEFYNTFIIKDSYEKMFE